jgi:acetyl esterase
LADVAARIGALWGKLATLPPTARRQLEQVRDRLRAAALHMDPNPPDMAETRHLAAPAAAPLPMRVYAPDGAAPGGPALLFFHGGGFLVGGLESHDGLCRRLAAASGVRIVSVAYRLAPEHRYPAQREDARIALDWLARNANRLEIDEGSIAVGGDSAGANMATVLAHESARGRAHPVRFQLLIYPWLKIEPEGLTERTGLTDVVDGIMRHCATNWLPPGADGRDPDMSPVYQTDLAGMAPAHIVTAGGDPLRHEGQAYADALAAAGVAVTRAHHDRLGHGDFNMAGINREAAEACAVAGARLAAAF